MKRWSTNIPSPLIEYHQWWLTWINWDAANDYFLLCGAFVLWAREYSWIRINGANSVCSVVAADEINHLKRYATFCYSYCANRVIRVWFVTHTHVLSQAVSMNRKFVAGVFLAKHWNRLESIAADLWRRLRLMCDMQRNTNLLREFSGALSRILCIREYSTVRFPLSS